MVIKISYLELTSPFAVSEKTTKKLFSHLISDDLLSVSYTHLDVYKRQVLILFRLRCFASSGPDITDLVLVKCAAKSLINFFFGLIVYIFFPINSLEV